MTFSTRYPRRLGHHLPRAVSRILFLVAAVLLLVTPAWRGARAIAAACAASGVAPAAPAGRPAPTVAFEEEELNETAALSRPELEIRRAADRAERLVASAVPSPRHRAQRDAVVAARRWSRYRAPPRAPPYRLLN